MNLKKIITRGNAYRIGLVLFDILAVYFSFWFALIARFYIGFSFRAGAESFLSILAKIMPGYALICLVVFGAFRLYRTLWRVAGVSDFRRVVYANVICTVMFLMYSLITRNRVPLTLYFIGPALQFLLTAGIRLFIRTVRFEIHKPKVKQQNDGNTKNTMVVGVGETANQVLRHMKRDENSTMKAVCFFDYSGSNGMIEGIPVVGGIDNLFVALMMYGVECVILADPSMPGVVRKRIREVCDERKVQVQDYMGYFQEAWGGMSINGFLEYVPNEVELDINGVKRLCSNGHEAAKYVTKDHSIKSMHVEHNHLVVELITFLTLMYITNDPVVAKIAEKNGVQRIWIDLETLGKDERQKNMNTVKSHHSIRDIERVSSVLSKSEVLVRVNPINPGSEEEINQVIAAGADMIMLPMWKCVDDVKTFLRYVAGRVKTTLLLETKEAAECLDAILELGGFDEIHIGLNDLHLSYGLTFMFELLANGKVEELCKKIAKKGIPYGFGGIARIGEGALPAEKIVQEHYRLGSTRAIVSRSFCNTEEIKDIRTIEVIFAENIARLRDCERDFVHSSEAEFEDNKRTISECIDKIVRAKRHIA